MARDHHDLPGWGKLFHAPERLQTIHFGHPDVQNHEIGRVGSVDLQGFNTIGCHLYLIPFIFKDTAQRGAYRLFIVHNQNRG